MAGVQAQGVPADAREARTPSGPAQSGEQSTSQSLVPAAAATDGGDEGFTLGPAMERLPVELEVAVPIREFRVRQLLALEPGQVVESQWSHGDDVHLAAGEVQLAWSEFEVIDGHLAVRVTRMS